MFFILFFFSLVILFSTIGYGLILSKLIKVEKFYYNFGLIGILGLFTLSIISSFSHLFFAHGYIHNIFIIITGIVFLFLDKTFTIKEFKFQSILFSCLFVALIMAKTNEDFGYYHLPNSIQFAQQKLQFGLGNLNHGFKHISSLFMIMSLTYLPFIDHYLFNLTNFLFMLFLISFIIKEIFNKKKINLNFSNIILSFIFILILSKFSRLSEYGSDLAGQIVIFIFIFFLIEIFYNNKIDKNISDYLTISIILIIFAITLKFISVIYIMLFLPLFFIKKKSLIKKILTTKNFIIIIFPTLIFIFLNFSATGCLIYPIDLLCFSDKFDWALSSNVIKYMNQHYEIWSKGGLGPTISVNNPEEYIKYFNWVPHWFKVYFIGKFTDYILVIFLIVIIFTSFFYNDLKKPIIKKHQIKKDIFVFFLLTLAIFFVWFLNFPTLRYAGYVIVFLLFIFPIALYLNNKVNLSNKISLKKITIIFLISYSVFFYKNITRVYNELQLTERDHHNFENFPLFWVNKNAYKKVILNNHILYFSDGSCWDIPSTCIKFLDNLKIIKKNGYVFYVIKK